MEKGKNKFEKGGLGKKSEGKRASRRKEWLQRKRMRKKYEEERGARKKGRKVGGWR